MTTTISKELSSELIDDDASIAPFLNENFDAVKYAQREIFWFFLKKVNLFKMNTTDFFDYFGPDYGQIGSRKQV